MRDFYLCYSAILTNTLVPQLGLSSILQNQLGVALDALTPAILVKIGDHCYHGLCDMGASVSAISYTLYQEIMKDIAHA